MSDTIHFSIFRFDPSRDAAPSYSDYDVPFQDDGETDFMSVLQCLAWISENVEQIAYDSNCGSGWCGRCGMVINGTPSLACWTKAEKGGSYTLEPLSGFPVIRDLVVNKSATYQKYVDAVLEVQRSEPMQTLVPIDYDFFYNTLHKFNRCRECMLCYSACPKTSSGVTDRFVGPGALMQVAMRYNDPNDEADRVWQAAFSGVLECDLCGECSSVCPATIDIVGQIAALQNEAKDRGLGNSGAYLSPTLASVAEGIAAAKAAGSNSSTSEKTSVANQPVEQIIAENCGTAGCHTAEDILAYKTDVEAATLRVQSHVASKVDLDEAKQQEFIDFFTE